MIAPEGARLLLVAGQTASEASGVVPPRSFVEQFGQVLVNVLTVVREAGGGPESIGRMTVYVTDMPTYRASLKELGAVWREHMGRHYPAMALVAVTALVDENALVEIEATAAVPASAP